MVVHPGRVSVVIPAYKADEYLPATLNSVSAQGYSDWEVLVVEDASVGKTEEIVAAFRARHSGHRVEYVRHPVNRGPSATRNTAFAMVQGEYVAFIDADDIWIPTHLERCVAALAEMSCGIVYSAVVTFEHDTERLIEVWGPVQKELTNFPGSLFLRNFMQPSSVVMHRSVLNLVAGLNTELRTCEDLDFWLRCASAGVRFQCLPGCHCLYRKGHAVSATMNGCRIRTNYIEVLETHYGMSAVPMRVQNRMLLRHYLVFVIRCAWREPRASARMLAKGLRLLLRPWSFF